VTWCVSDVVTLTLSAQCHAVFVLRSSGRSCFHASQRRADYQLGNGEPSDALPQCNIWGGDFGNFKRSFVMCCLYFSSCMSDASSLIKYF